MQPPAEKSVPISAKHEVHHVTAPPKWSPQQVEFATNSTIRPVDATIPTTKHPLLLDTTRPVATESLVEEQFLRWIVTTSEPMLPRQQIKMVASQIEGVVIIQEQEDLLLLSIPTPKLEIFREELAKLGTVSNPKNEGTPNTSTTLVSIKFIRMPSVAAATSSVKGVD